MNLTKVNIIGKHAFYIYTKDSDGTRNDVECSLADYWSKTSLTELAPNVDGHTYTGSAYECWKHDTVDGMLHEGQYAKEPDRDKIAVHAVGKEIVNLPSSVVVNDVLSQVGIDRIDAVNLKINS